MNERMDIEVTGGFGLGEMELTSPSGWEMEIESGHEAELMTKEMPCASAGIEAGGIVPEGTAYAWEEEMEMTTADFAYVYIGPALEDTSSTDAWFHSDGWFRSEAW